ncbi:MAG: AAA family ATPase [Candidatus Caldarchaeum sp.]|nr:AAA family ATPase [Candidatus Caldarchaeum sp.]
MPVFVDRAKLSSSHLPNKLIHREKEKQLLTNLILSGVERSSDSFVAKAVIIGGVGAGKTTLCLMVGREIERTHKETKHLYVNLRRFSTSRVSIYRHIVKTISPEAYSPSLSAEELLENLLLSLKQSREKLFVTFDDADYHVSASRGRETIIYEFTRLHEISDTRPINVVAVVFVFRDQSYGKLLDRPEISSLGANVVSLPPYNKQQIFDIISERADEAFRKGAVSHDVLEFVAEIVSEPPYSGDVRFALDLLLYAGNIAESRGLDVVKIDDVRRAVSESSYSFSVAELAELPERMKAVLLSVAKSVLRMNTSSAAVAEVRKTYEMFCEIHGLPGSGFEKALKQLALLGYVRMLDGGNVELLRVDARRLIEVLGKLLKNG